MVMGTWKIWTPLLLSMVYASPPPPVQNYTVITYYTDTMTWNDADVLCKSFGGKLLDISYYSIFAYMFSIPGSSEAEKWLALPVPNGDPAWIAMHRRITPIGDHFYNGQCQPLEEYNIVDWGADQQVDPDGEPDSMCVMHQVMEESENYYVNDFTMANCSEQRPFYCQEETGPCTFEEISGYAGYTSNDISSNDITIPFTSVDACTDYCLNVSTLYEYAGPPPLDVTEECWGFTVSGSICKIHQIIMPMHFDKYKSASSSSTLYIKRCFEATVNETTFNIVESDLAEEPNSTCGIPVIGNSTAPATKPVFVHTGSLTWNDAFTVCEEAGQNLLNIESEDINLLLQDLIPKYKALGVLDGDTVWLGIHEPKPATKPNVRMWSDCSAVETTNWDPDNMPSPIVFDAALCAYLNTSSMLWQSAMCNETHQFLCVGEAVSQWAYDTGTNSILGLGTTLGPYNVTSGECLEMCSTWTYKEEECWAYGFLDINTDETFCRLYFAPNASIYITSFETVSDPYTFYRKVLWEDSVANTTSPLIADNSMFPYSCCPVGNMNVTYECPSSTVPELDENIPTTTGIEFMLYYEPATWNQANSECSNKGGRLFEIDTLAKRHAIQYFLTAWTQSGELVRVSNSLDSDETRRLFRIQTVCKDAGDDCSLSWAQDCTRPSWLEIDPPISNNSYCAVYRDTSRFELRECNTTNQFICQRETGACSMSEVANDRYCVIGNYQVVSPSVCYDSCLTATYNGKECWAVMEVNKHTCALLYYTDPMDCKEQYYYDRGQDVTFKTCFTSSVDSTFEVTADLSNTEGLSPETDCTIPFRYPYQRNSSVCRNNKLPRARVSASATPISATTASTTEWTTRSILVSTSPISSGLANVSSVTSPSRLSQTVTPINQAQTFTPTGRTVAPLTSQSPTVTPTGVTPTPPTSQSQTATSTGDTAAPPTSQSQTFTPTAGTAAPPTSQSQTFTSQSQTFTPTGGAAAPPTSQSQTTTPTGGTAAPPTSQSQTFTPTGGTAAPPTSQAQTFTTTGGTAAPPTSQSQTFTPTAGTAAPPTSQSQTFTTTGGTAAPPTSQSQTFTPTAGTAAPPTSQSQTFTPTGGAAAPPTSQSQTTTPTGGTAAPPTSQSQTFTPTAGTAAPPTSQSQTFTTTGGTAAPPTSQSQTFTTTGGTAAPPTSQSQTFTTTAGTAAPPTSQSQTFTTTGGTAAPPTSQSQTFTPTAGTAAPPTSQSHTFTPIGGTAAPPTSQSQTFTPTGGAAAPPTSQSQTTTPIYLGTNSSIATVTPAVATTLAAPSSTPGTITVDSTSTYAYSLSITNSVSLPISLPTQLPSDSTTSSFTNTSPAGTYPSSPFFPSSSSPISAAYSADPYNGTAIFLWPCLCNHFPKSNLTLEEWNAWLVLTNTEDRKSLSKFRRSRTCAEDNRTSAISVGAVGLGMIVSTLVIMVFADLSTMLAHFLPLWRL